MAMIDPVAQHLLLEGIFLKYGYDFRQYAEASLHRRLQSLLLKFRITDPLDLLKMILNDKDFFIEALPLFTVNTTEIFRDPLFFKALREKVLPVLKTYPRLNFWVAGCSSGEEVHTLSIILHEEGMAARSTIFATDISPTVLKTAREGIYSAETLKVFAKNYVVAGGTKNPSEYYTADYGFARFDPRLRENVIFTEHNLVTDSVFAECNLILCRNVMIYFRKNLQERVFKLLLHSLAHKGFLGIGSKESIRFSSIDRNFETIDAEQKIFQKNSHGMPAFPGPIHESRGFDEV